MFEFDCSVFEGVVLNVLGWFFWYVVGRLVFVGVYWLGGFFSVFW